MRLIPGYPGRDPIGKTRGYASFGAEKSLLLHSKKLLYIRKDSLKISGYTIPVTKITDCPMKESLKLKKSWDRKAPFYEWIRNFPGLSWILNAENRAVGRLFEEMSIPEDSKILDIGTGDGNVIELFPEKSRKNIIGLDTNKAMLTRARIKYPGTHFLQGDSRFLPVQDNSINVVTCIGLSEYIEDLSLLLKEIKRALSARGLLLLTISPKSIFTSLRNLTGATVYARSSEEAEKICANQGFEVRKMSRTFMQVQYLVGIKR